ncbi:ribosome-associated ATPase/putative transporter RbbA [Stappia sp. F7233]|uniref:Ribosome-associated ATPase/putative transporter RbbA n=1 Tax=Stappia albiluteola TaxID=2758565 RepID=A0A839AG44_9HYPH|nr:ribosome-associated ATPase/putative transporter RbbA [Stappia albiluteola]MBA5778066.1 ribosome-associated ATPase/putative transporter RbbA [Stappia albiluteola]
MTGAAPVVLAEGVGHLYAKTVALQAVDLTVSRGEAIGIVGPDGVGKSSLLSLIAGVKRLQSGRLEVFGGSVEDGAHRDLVATRIAFMPQGLGKNLYPTLSVRENLDFFGRLYAETAAERSSRIDRLLAATGLAPFPDRPAGKLSGGMRQKLALCCSLIHDPDLLILDEPTTGVDPLSRRQFWELIDGIRAERPSMTVLVATAYMEEASRFQRLIAMNEGRILADGPVSEILRQTGARTLERAYVALSSGNGNDDGGQDFEIPPRIEHDGPPAIRANGLTRRFGSFTAVDHVSFEIGKGEIFGFLGSNGCGKTTTMKMLTGLLEASEGTAELLGHPVDARDISVRMRVGYVSQSFSLYEELSVEANLALHARLYRLSDKLAAERIADAMERFGLAPFAKISPLRLPLGIRQRLQLAAACLHRPEMLILDEPTSGVDPSARDLFWRFLIDLSRNDGVTIFISTHFMHEAERCDRISLMHAGRVLAVGTPAELVAARDADSLDAAFISYLEEFDGGEGGAGSAGEPGASLTEAEEITGKAALVGLRRVRAFALREALELIRDPIRLSFALLGPLLLMVAMAYGISFDVEDVSFATLDRDRTVESRELVENFRGSRYFAEKADLATADEIAGRLQSGDVQLVIDIPPRYGSDLLAGRRPEVAFLIDGSNPFRAETIRGYLSGVVLTYLQARARSEHGNSLGGLPINIEPRFRYNQAFLSVYAITPGTIMLLLVMIPAMLTAVGVVREKELGSILNLYAAPASVLEFLIGKQLPYIAVGMAAYALLLSAAWVLFGVTVNGSFLGLTLGAFFYVFAATAFGLLISSFVTSQMAAIFATAILSIIPAINFSGFLYPTANLEGPAAVIGLFFPSSWFQTVSIGNLAKGMGFLQFVPEYAALFAFGIVFLALARLVQAKQET